MPIAYIGIGSNLGNREENILRAVAFLSEAGIVIRERSSLHETEPWGIKDQPKFLNMVLEGETDKEPTKLLETLKKIERALGRTDTYRWGPRVIDLDILFYDDLVIKEPSLQIPHPRMHERDFVLKPLSEIASEKIHPVFKKSVRELLSALR
ncbi:MAG: 2-amino-4-hydroxy-6-hydroxymethyldihydropteridine diphosphokinase [Thermodesulfovibrionales bacterium]|jgi:2-amino-4-hydroxy-6-hydroxymethyldihydropteridine diphosphokinase